MNSIVALLALACVPPQAISIPDTLPGKRLSEFITAFNTKDKKQIDSMVGRNYAKSALRLLSKEEWATRIAGATDIAPIAVEKVLKSADYAIVVRLSSKSQLPLGLRLDLEEDLPYGIIGAKMGAPSELLGNSAPKKYSKWAELANLADLIRNDYKLPALCIGFEKLGEKPQEVLVGVRSTQDNDTLDPTDRLLVGGIGKAMTATLVARMIELKKLSWNTTLAAALPGIKMQDAYKDVTIDQLLHHGAGLPIGGQFSQDELERLSSKAQSATDIRRIFVTDVLSKDPVSIAGNRFTDSTSEFVVAGYIIERLIGKSYEWLMQRYVFDPMKLSTALIAPQCSDGQVGSLGNVFGHLQSDMGYVPYQIPATKLDLMLAPAGSCISCSLGDILRFGEFHLKGLKGDAQVLNAESYKRLHALAQGQDVAGGWSINPAFAGEPCHAIAGTNGSFYADLTLWPDSDLVIVSVTNAATSRQPSPTLQAILAVRDRLEKRD